MKNKLKTPIHAMDFDVAMALGYVPNYKQPRWKVAWNRFRARMWPANPPRAPYNQPSSDVQDTMPLSVKDQAEVIRQMKRSDDDWKQHNLLRRTVEKGEESPAFKIMRDLSD